MEKEWSKATKEGMDAWKVRGKEGSREILIERNLI